MAIGDFMSMKTCVVAGAGEVRAPYFWLAVVAKRWRWQGIARAVGAALGKGGGGRVAAGDQPRLSGRDEQVAMRKEATGELRRSGLSSIPGETERLHPDRYRPRQKRTLTSGSASFFLLGLMSLCLVGCGNDDRPAPKPTINPDAHVYTTIRILVSDPRIDDVRVESDWVVGNLGCAPIIYPAGYARVQQISAPEQVKKIKGGYQSKLLEDRFKNDKCHWLWGGPGISLMHHGRGFSTLGLLPNDIKFSGQKTIICTPPFDIDKHHIIGVCYPPGSSTPQLEKTPGKFTVTLEVES